MNASLESSRSRTNPVQPRGAPRRSPGWTAQKFIVLLALFALIASPVVVGLLAVRGPRTDRRELQREFDRLDEMSAEMSIVKSAAFSFEAATGSRPVDAEELVGFQGVVLDEVTDPWGRLYRLEWNHTIEAVSAGPDAADRADDMDHREVSERWGEVFKELYGTWPRN